MNNNLVFVIAFVIVAMIIGSIVLRKVKSNKAAKQAEQFAMERNWRYASSDTNLIKSYPQLFPFYVSGESTSRPGISFGDSSTGVARDVLYFQSGENAGHSFTYTYTSHDTDSDNTSSTKNHFWHVVGLEIPVPFPNLIVRRRRKLDMPQSRLTKAVQLSSPELNSLYSVHSEHHPLVVDVMTPEMVQWLVDGQFQDEMVLQDRRIYVFSKGRQKLANIDPMLSQLNGFLSRIPAEVWQKAGGEYPRPDRVQMFDSLDLGKMKDAYKDWRDSK